jgi:predicted AAA+ superfamily ATPase
MDKIMPVKPWREVVTPHPDVAAGRYRQAEFAADLAQVLSGKAEAEYQDPVEFFARTYLTEGMTLLLTSSLRRVAGVNGEPVFQIKTAFGGGKTHTMLALYHLLNGSAPADKLAGAETILKAAGVKTLPTAKFAVLVGTALDPSKPRKLKGTRGLQMRTLWGDLAAQIGGAEAYQLIANADKASVAPGSDTLVELFDQFGPCVILIDELVAYCRNLYHNPNLPAGSFDSNLTFIQALTEAAKRSRNSLVVASIPESDLEIGGEGGKEALKRLEHTFGRLEAVWKPVGAQEGFEIVRRRLFMPIQDETARDETCRAFSRMYTSADSADFPPECREGTYLDRLRVAYPIHPEFFDRLYDDWATLESFQKTRGVLRLMAAVIHELWTRDDRSAMILPGSIPLEAQTVREELIRYLPEGWSAVVDKDVDGPRSEPRRIDEGNPRLGALLAARRVARAVFLGSAPSVRQQNVRGIEDIRVRLGVTQPGEPVAVFNDALSRLADRLTHLYVGNRRYWFDTQPNLLRTMEDRAVRLEAHDVEAEIIRRLRLIRDRGDFRAVHVCPTSSADVPDEQEVRLVVLLPHTPHHRNRQDSHALAAAIDIINQRGNSPRQYANMLVFAAPDEDLVPGLEQETRRYLAWKSIMEDAEALNLDAHQRRQASESLERSDETVNLRIHEAYSWLIVPTQDGTNPINWETVRIAGGGESFILKASKKLKSDQHLITRWSPALLRMELDKWLWKDSNHLGVKKLWDYLCRYPYLPRLQDVNVLLEAIKDGVVRQDYFAYATRVGEDERYQGLSLGSSTTTIYFDDASVLVKPEIARQQLDTDTQATTPPTTYSQPNLPGDARKVANGSTPNLIATATGPTTTRSTARRFHGVVKLDETRIARDAGRVAEEVIQHLTSQLGAKVEITLEIHAQLPNGAAENVVRTVSENARTLKFESSGFEEE